MPHAQITQCALMMEVCQYTCQKYEVAPINDVANNHDEIDDDDVTA